MDGREALDRAKYLHDQVHQTAERGEHLQERMPLGVRPESLNYGEDLERLKAEYGRFVQQAMAGGLLGPQDLEREGLPLRFDQTRQG